MPNLLTFFAWHLRLSFLSIVVSLHFVAGCTNFELNFSGNGDAEAPYLSQYEFSEATRINGTVFSLVLGSNGLYVGGEFDKFEDLNVAGPHASGSLVRISESGKHDPGFNVDSGFGYQLGKGIVRTMVEADDGALFVGGKFTNYQGVATNGHLVKLNADGSRDSNYPESTFGSEVYAILVDPTTGGLWVGIQNSLLRLDATGTEELDLSDDNLVSGKVRALAAGENNKIYVGDDKLDCVIRLNESASRDTSFDTPEELQGDHTVRTLLVSRNVGGEEVIYVGGDFDGKIIRLESDGDVDTSFDLSSPLGRGGADGFSGGDVYTLTLAGDGTKDVLVGGSFSTYRGTAVSSLVRISPSGELVADLAVSSDKTFSLATNGKGQVIVGGQSTSNFLLPDALVIKPISLP